MDIQSYGDVEIAVSEVRGQRNRKSSSSHSIMSIMSKILSRLDESNKEDALILVESLKKRD